MRCRTLARLLLLGYATLLAGGASGTFAASFPCEKASTTVEKSICGYPALSKLDEDLAAAYKNALLAVALDSDRKASLIAAQRDWLKERNACADVACLEGSMKARLTALAPLHAPAAAAAGAPSGAPSAGGSSPVAQPQSILDALKATLSVKGEQVGFKDYRLGRSLTAEGPPQGTMECKPVLSFAPGDNQALQASTLEALRARWGVSLGSVRQCSAKGSIFEKAVQVTYRALGPEQLIYEINLTLQKTDVATLTEVLSKSFGKPSEASSTESIAKLREELHQQNLSECESMRSSAVGYADCVQGNDQQINAKILMGNVPAEGIVTTVRSWSPPGAEINLRFFNIKDDLTVSFIASAGEGFVTAEAQKLIAEQKRLEGLAAKVAEQKRAQDF
jgi:uncharacterized protein